MVQRTKCIINDEKMIRSSPIMKSSPCSNHLSSVSFMRKWFLLLASVPFSPVLFSLHFCESGDRALKCKGFLFSGKYGETLCCALVTKNNSPASVKPPPDRKESLSAKVSTKNEWQQQQQQQRLWHRRKRSTPFPEAGQAGPHSLRNPDDAAPHSHPFKRPKAPFGHKYCSQRNHHFKRSQHMGL